MHKMQKILSCNGEGWIVVNAATTSKPKLPNTEQSNQDHHGWEMVFERSLSYQLWRKFVTGHHNLSAMCEETQAECEENFKKITQSPVESQI